MPGVAEPFAVKCFVSEITCISLMAMEIHFSDTGGRRESVEQIDPGPSLDEIIMSMQQHLRCSGEASDVVYARSRGNGTDGLCGGVDSTRGCVIDTSLLSHTVYTAPWTYDSATDGIYGDNDASECEEIPLPVLTREMLRRHTDAENKYASNRDQVQELDFHEDVSVTEAPDERDEGDRFLDPASHPRLSTPFYQQLRVKYPQAFQRRSSSTSMTSEVSSVCPDHSYLDTTSDHSPQNGLPPRPPLPTCSRKGVNFCVDGSRHDSGDTSIVGCPQRRHRSRLAERSRVPTPLQGILKKDTPFPGTQSTVTDTSVSSPLSLKERLKQNQETFRHLMSDENSPFGRRKTSCSNKAASLSASLPLNTVQSVCTDGPVPERSLADGGNRKHVRTKRFASPDSMQDSAVDMDSASVQSVQMDTAGIALPKTQQTNSAYTSGLSKLRCRQRVGTHHNSDWCNSSKPPTGVGTVNHGKDSDEDSGIAYGCHLEHQIPGYSLEPRSASNNHLNGPSRTTRKDHCTAALSTMNDPFQIHHSVGQHEDLLEIGYDPERQVDTMETSMLAGQPSSVTQKHREVTFVDEIPHQPLYRACSQPLLDSHSEVPSGVRTLHRVLHFGGEIGETERSHQKTPHKLTRYHSEEDLLDGHVGFTQPQHKSHEHAFRQRCTSAMAEIITSINHENIESSMEIHRASPAVVLPVPTNQHVLNKPPRPPAANKRQQCRKCLSSPESSGNLSEHGVNTLSDQELDEEVMRASGFITDRLGLQSQHSDRKRFKLPWRKNRGHFTPSKEMKKMAKAQSYGHSASCSSCTSGGSSPCGNQMAPMNGRSNCAEPWNCRTLNMKTPVTALSEITAPSGGNYETVREFRAPVNTVHNGSISHKSPARMESDYQTVDAVNKVNKLIHDCAKPPTGRTTSKKRHIVVSSDGDYEVVSDCAGDVELNWNNGRSQSQLHVDSDYEMVDVISRTTKPPRESSERNGGIPGHVNGNTATQQDHTHAVYAEVDFTKKTRKTTSCSTTECDESITHLPLPPLPFRGYESDLQRHHGLSGSRTSLADKMGGFRQSMKRKFSRLRKAVSLDRLDKTDSPASEPSSGLAGSRWKSPSLTSLTSHFKKTNQKSRKAKRLSRHAKRQSASMTELDDAETPKKFQPIGQLKQINCDGTQVIELSKPKDGPFGFYIARGSAKYNHGIFVSRLSDSLPPHFFAGLLNVGDEIFEINGTSMKNISLEETYDLMAKQNQLLLKIMPFMARRDT